MAGCFSIKKKASLYSEQHRKRREWSTYSLLGEWPQPLIFLQNNQVFYRIKEKRIFMRWVYKTAAFCLWETCRRIAWQTCGRIVNTKSGEFTKIHGVEESNFQAIRGLCEQFMHHTKFSLMCCAILNFAEFLSFVVAHKIVVGLAIDVLEILRNRVLQMVFECCQVLCN